MWVDEWVNERIERRTDRNEQMIEQETSSCNGKKKATGGPNRRKGMNRQDQHIRDTANNPRSH